MSVLTYPDAIVMSKPLVWLRGEIRTPPFSRDARIEAGFLLRRLQDGELLGMPASRPLPDVGANCHELRIVDRDATWRVVYHVATDAIVILEIFSKKTRTLPREIALSAKRRLKQYLRLIEED
jgi:phage-related protein